METVTDLIVNILALVIQLVIIVAGGALVRWLRARYSADQILKARDLAFIAVQAVEQMAAAGGWRWPSATKMTQARNRFKELAAGAGVRLTDEHIDALLEAAVLELKALGRELPRGGKPAA